MLEELASADELKIFSSNQPPEAPKGHDSQAHDHLELTSSKT